MISTGVLQRMLLMAEALPTAPLTSAAKASAGLPLNGNQNGGNGQRTSASDTT